MHNGQESLLLSSIPPLNSPPPAIPPTTIAMNWHAGVVCCFQRNVTFSPVALCAGLYSWFSKSERDEDMEDIFRRLMDYKERERGRNRLN